MPSEMLPTISWPRCRSDSNESVAPGSRSGLTIAITVDAMTMTRTSESITNASLKVASGPCARVCDRIASVAAGLRVMLSTPQRSATPAMVTTACVRVNGNSGVTATKIARGPDEDEHALRERRRRE